MLDPSSTSQQEVLADEAKASSGVACNRTKNQQQRARKPQQLQQQQQHSHSNQQRPGLEQQQLLSNQLSVATACLLQGQRSQYVDECLGSRGLAEALQAARTCKVRILRLPPVGMPLGVLQYSSKAIHVPPRLPAVLTRHCLQEYLQQSLFAEAIVALVRGCAKSTFCLALLQDTARLWPIAMAKARHTTHKEHGRARGLPHVV